MTVEDAFKALRDALQAALDSAKAEGARAFEDSEFDAAQTAAQHGAMIESFLQEVEDLAGRWEARQRPTGNVQEVREAAARISSARVHLNEEDLTMPILQALQELGGKGSARQVLDHVEGLIGSELHDESSGPDGWRLSAQTASAALVKKGYISAESPEGEWKLTTKGRLYFFEQQ